MCWQVCMHYAMGSFGMLMCALLLICVLSTDRLACSMPIAVSACSWTRFRSYARHLPTGSHALCQGHLRYVHGRTFAHTRTICRQARMHHANGSLGTRMGVLSLICAPSADRLTCAMPIAVSTRICTCPSTFPHSKQAPGDRATKFSLMRARLP